MMRGWGTCSCPRPRGKYVLSVLRVEGVRVRFLSLWCRIIVRRPTRRVRAPPGGGNGFYRVFCKVFSVHWRLYARRIVAYVAFDDQTIAGTSKPRCSTRSMEVRPSSQFKRSRLTVLPPELVVRCLEFLPFGEVHTEAKQVSKGMRAAARRALTRGRYDQHPHGDY